MSDGCINALLEFERAKAKREKRIIKCESCGKNELDKEENFCYGCGHIICVDCCTDEDGVLIAGEHDLGDHKRALKKKATKK